MQKPSLEYTSLKYSTVFGILSVVSLFVRFPFFFRDYIDRDESTFILMAQSWVDGNLPYTELWDLKPPLAFLFFSGIITIFGKSFFAIRLGGTFLVAITSFFTYKIGTTITTKKIAFWSALACVALQSMFGSIQGVMSEHLCMAFLTPAIYLIIKYKDWYWLGFAGVLMGISIMMKLNMAYSLLLIGLYLIYHFIKNKEYRKGVLGVTFYGLGILSVIVITLLPYYLQGLQELWWKSVIIAPIDYAKASRSPISKLLLPFLAFTLFFFSVWKKKYLDFKNPAIQILLVTILGVLYSFFKAGRINSHYLIQLYPIFIITAGIVVGTLPVFRKFKLHKKYLLLLLLLPMESYLEYFNIVKHKKERGSFYNGEGITVPKYLRENNIDTNNILFIEYHIGYWMLGQNPPSKAATHPSNIGKPEMFPAFDNPRKTGIEELRFIMETVQPQTLVTRKNRLFFDELQVELNTYLNAYLAKNYTILANVDDAEIYTRLR